MGVHLWVSHLFWRWWRSLWRRTLLTERLGVPHPTGSGHTSGGRGFWRRQNIALYAVQKRIPTVSHRPQRQQQQQNPDGGLSLAQLPSRKAIEEGAGTETGRRSGSPNVILGQGGGSSSLSSNNNNKGNKHESIIIVRPEIENYSRRPDPTRPSSNVLSFYHHTYG